MAWPLTAGEFTLQMRADLPIYSIVAITSLRFSSGRSAINFAVICASGDQLLRWIRYSFDNGAALQPQLLRGAYLASANAPGTIGGLRRSVHPPTALRSTAPSAQLSARLCCPLQALHPERYRRAYTISRPRPHCAEDSDPGLRVYS